MDLIRCFVFIDELETMPSKRTIVNSAMGILLLFMTIFGTIAITASRIIWLNWGIVQPIEEIVGFTIGGWLLATTWFLVSNWKESISTELVVYGLLSVIGTYLVAPLLGTMFIYYTSIVLGAIAWFVFLALLSGTVNKHRITFVKVRWMFLGAMILYYGGMLLFDLYDGRYSFEPYITIKAILFAVELSIVSYFILLEFVEFRQYMEASYDGQMSSNSSNIVNETEAGSDELNYTMKSMFVLYAGFLMLFILCFRIGGLVLAIL